MSVRAWMNFWMRRKRSRRAPMTILVHQELRVPWKVMAVWMIPKMRTPITVPAR